jgi:MtN3 and saliva related transmembrane protein
MPHLHDLVGYAAGFLATAAFVPQVVKTFKARSARDISLGMYVLFCAGVALWLAYGLLIASWPVIVSNTVTLVLSGAVLVLKLRHG